MSELVVDEEQRLRKLWEAYKAQEEELARANEKLERAESLLAERDAAAADVARKVDLAEERARELDRRLAERESAITALEEERDALKALETYRDRVEELTAAYERERERLAKLFVVYEETVAERDALAAKLGEAARAG
ncbi:MAG TPA: hypothetical protein VM889_08720 [Candidatus Thermoplasmatota archaeon]|nr:hypothetical protein [Candidatus Thermoplasmatota archaeon]